MYLEEQELKESQKRLRLEKRKQKKRNKKDLKNIDEKEKSLLISIGWNEDDQTIDSIDTSLIDVQKI